MGSVPEYGPDHRSWENLVRVLHAILKGRAGPKHIFKMGCVGDSIPGVISSLGGWCYGTLKTSSKAHGRPSPHKACR